MPVWRSKTRRTVCRKVVSQQPACPEENCWHGAPRLQSASWALAQSDGSLPDQVSLAFDLPSMLCSAFRLSILCPWRYRPTETKSFSLQPRASSRSCVCSSREKDLLESWTEPREPTSHSGRQTASDSGTSPKVGCTSLEPTVVRRRNWPLFHLGAAVPGARKTRFCTPLIRERGSLKSTRS